MSGVTQDSLYRSDARPSGWTGQQADLAPVSDQPSEHWEQKAEQREAQEPAPPTDPMGAQPQAEASAPDGVDRSGSESGAAAPTSQPVASSSSPSSDPAASVEPRAASSDDANETMSRTDKASAQGDVDQDMTVAAGGEVAWSDPAGDHARSGEVSMDMSQAATLGGSATLAQAGRGLTQTGAEGSSLDAVAHGALAQAAALTQGEMIMQTDALSGALGQISTLSSALEAAPAAAIESATAALDGVSALAETLPVGDLSQATEVLDVVTAPALPSLDLELPTEAVAAPSGLLAALFTPQVADAAEPMSGMLDLGSDDTALPDLDVGGLAAPIDDGLDLGLGGF